MVELISSAVAGGSPQHPGLNGEGGSDWRCQVGAKAVKSCCNCCWVNRTEQPLLVLRWEGRTGRYPSFLMGAPGGLDPVLVGVG